MITLPNKTPAEDKVVTFDFAPEANSNSVLSSPTVAKSVISGNDPGAVGLQVGVPAVSGLTVMVMIVGGLDGVAYELLCTAHASNGEIHQIAAGLGISVDAV